MRSQDTSLGGPGANFAETAWGMVERARDTSPEIRQGGLEELSRSYWKPVYHYLRVAWAKSNEDAKDLAQAFFLWLTDRQALKKYTPERGSFRTFLKALLRRIEAHFAKRPGTLDILYVNAECRNVLDRHPAFTRLWLGPVSMSPEDHAADLAAIAQQKEYGSTGDEECAIYRYTGRSK